jgi:hypothetical protein
MFGWKVRTDLRSESERDGLWRMVVADNPVGTRVDRPPPDSGGPNRPIREHIGRLSGPCRRRFQAQFAKCRDGIVDLCAEMHFRMLRRRWLQMPRLRLYLRKASSGSTPIQAAKKVYSASTLPTERTYPSHGPITIA